MCALLLTLEVTQGWLLLLLLLLFEATQGWRGLLLLLTEPQLALVLLLVTVQDVQEWLL